MNMRPAIKLPVPEERGFTAADPEKTATCVDVGEEPPSQLPPVAHAELVVVESQVTRVCPWAAGDKPQIAETTAKIATPARCTEAGRREPLSALRRADVDRLAAPRWSAAR